MEFIHIAPTSYLHQLECISKQRTHLLLAHLIESDASYRQYYQTARLADPELVYIMDNSAFEMYQQGKPMFDADRLINLADQVGADYIVLPDYPNQHQSKTIEAAKQWAPAFRAAGYKTFFCPQSNIGDLPGLIEAVSFAAFSDLIDYIGVSIIAVPNAFGVEKNNNLQRYLARHYAMTQTNFGQAAIAAKMAGKKIHFLGMVDGPREISLVREVLPYIDTWDSSSAIWHGINGIRYDNSPTGLVNGKLNTHVDFDIAFDESTVRDIEYNVSVIDSILEPYC